MQTTTRTKKVKRGSKVVEKVDGFSIREIRPGYFFVQARRKGLNKAQGFSSLEAAKLQCTAWATALTNEGLSAFTITQSQRLDAKRALDALAGRSTLEAAAAYWKSHHPDHGALTLRQMVEKYADDLKARNCRPVTIAERKQRLARLCKDYGDRAACSILTGDLQKWLDLRGAGPVNRGNYRRVFTALFNYAVDNAIMPANPANRLPVPQADEKMPEFLPVATVEAMMKEARAKYPALVPFLAVGAFAGLRPDEARGLKWENVNLSERHIRVLPETSKTRRARLVAIPSNLARWLAEYKKESGPIGLAKITETRWRRKIMQKIKLDRWPPDVLRHSFATYQLAKVPDVAALAETMGNSPSVIYRHYKGLATAKEAGKYFKIVPPKKPSKAGKVIPFKENEVAA